MNVLSSYLSSNSVTYDRFEALKRALSGTHTHTQAHLNARHPTKHTFYILHIKKNCTPDKDGLMMELTEQ